MVVRPGMNIKNFETRGQTVDRAWVTDASVDDDDPGGRFFKAFASWRECNAAEYTA